MNKRIAIVLLAVAALLGACTERGYDAKPVVSQDDPRETYVPDMGDTKGRESQNCFMIEIYATGWSSDDADEGIACMVEDER